MILILFFSIFVSGCIKDNANQKASFTFIEEIENSLALGEKWIVKNLNDAGYFNYYYNVTSGFYSSSNNMIRQFMASRYLAEMSQGNNTLQSLHQKNLDYIFNNWYRENGDIGYIYFDSKSKLGAMAMMLRTLVYSPFFDNYIKEAYKLVNCLLYLQNPDGSFNAWYIEPGYSYNEAYLLKFYSGEVILSLIEFYEKTGNVTVLNHAIFSQDFYIEEYVNNMSRNYYPAYVPWHTQSLNKIYLITGEKKYADAIFTLNDELLKIQDTENNVTLGRFFNYSFRNYGKPHSSSDGVYTEGIAYAYEIALIIDDEQHIDKYKEAIKLGARNLIKLQYNESESQRYNYPERLVGAIRINNSKTPDISRFNIRIDTTQHAMDGFRKIINIYE